MVVEVTEKAVGIVTLAGDAVVIMVVDGSVVKSTPRVVTFVVFMVGIN